MKKLAERLDQLEIAKTTAESEPSEASFPWSKRQLDLSHDSVEERLDKIEKEHREMRRDLVDIRCKVLNMESSLEIMKKRILQIDNILEKMEDSQSS